MQANNRNVHGEDYELKSLACNYRVIQKHWINDIKHFVPMKNCSFSFDTLVRLIHFFLIFLYLSLPLSHTNAHLLSLNLNIYRFSQVEVDEDELNDFKIPAQPNIFTYSVSCSHFVCSIFFIFSRVNLYFLLLSLAMCYLEQYPDCDFLFVSN